MRAGAYQSKVIGSPCSRVRAIWRMFCAAVPSGSSAAKRRRWRTARQTASSWYTKPGAGGADAEVARAGGHELRADGGVGGAAHLVHHEARAEGGEGGLQRRQGRRALVLHRAQQLHRRADAPQVGRVHGEIEDLLGLGVVAGRAQAAEQRALDEAVAVLDRRRLRRHHHQVDVRHQEEVDDVERGPRPQVHQDDVRVDGLQPAQQPHLLLVLDVGGGQEVGGAADQAQPREVRLHRDVLDALHAAQDEVGEGALGRGHAEAGVQVRAAEVRVDQHHTLAQPRQLPAQGGGDDGLADPALAAAHRPHLAARRAGDEGGKRVAHLRVTLERTASRRARVSFAFRAGA